MTKTYSGQQVKLARELTDLRLQEGQIGIVRDIWSEPTPAYDVEFECAGQPLRVLLLEHFVTAVGAAD